jgi:60 kDa SS-A/Ro ribonucleoprotein
MSNKKLFSNKSSAHSNNVKPADTVNEAGGKAYTLPDKAALAQFALTGCFGGTYYNPDPKHQLDKVLELSKKVDTVYLAKLAVYAREKGLMKDMPALLASIVASRDINLFTKIFDKVIDNPKMLRNFVQITRSGVTGRKSLGTRPKKLIQNYLNKLTDEQLFKADIGNDPSLQDIIKLTHPKPNSKSRAALYSYLLDKEYNRRDLLPLASSFEEFKKDMSKEIPDVPFQLLTALPLTDKHWKNIAENATWNQIRMNLNTFARHNVFNDNGLVNKLAEKLSNSEQVKRAKVLPYNLFSAFINVDSTVPVKLTNALQDAAQHALSNIPEFKGKVYVMVDTSGSMSSSVSGYRSTATSKVRCIDAAALFASAIMAKNPETEIVPFDTSVHSHRLNPRDSIMTNARTLASFGGGGTNCSCALQHLNNKSAKGDLVIYLSDNESWADPQHYRSTATMREWEVFKNRNPKARLVNIDIIPSYTAQVHDREDILNIGGFNDTIFEIVSLFAQFGNSKDLWVSSIEALSL